jgi:hypothetical protein
MDMGWLTGFEPATTATTTQRSTELSYSHHEAALTIEVLGDVGDVAIDSGSAISRAVLAHTEVLGRDRHA